MWLWEQPETHIGAQQASRIEEIDCYCVFNRGTKEIIVAGLVSWELYRLEMDFKKSQLVDNMWNSP